MNQQSHYWAYILKKPYLKKSHVPQCSLCTTARTWKQQMTGYRNCSTSIQWLLLIVSPKELDEPRAYYTEWSQSERVRQILYINSCVWNLERWSWWTYLQGSRGDTEIEKRLVDTAGQGEGGTNGEGHRKIYMTICKIDMQRELAV